MSGVKGFRAIEHQTAAFWLPWRRTSQIEGSLARLRRHRRHSAATVCPWTPQSFTPLIGVMYRPNLKSCVDQSYMEAPTANVASLYISAKLGKSTLLVPSVRCCMPPPPLHVYTSNGDKLQEYLTLGDTRISRPFLIGIQFILGLLLHNAHFISTSQDAVD